MLTLHNRAGEKHRKHQHYLKGTLYCGQCKSRLGIMNAKGRHGGIYPYFYCLGRQRRNGCDQPYVLIETIEKEVCEFYRTVQLASEHVEVVVSGLAAELKVEQELGATETVRQEARIRKLESKRRLLSDRVLDGSVPPDIGRERQIQITKELNNAHTMIDAHKLAYGDIETTLIQARALVRNCHAAYVGAGGLLRRKWNQAFFRKLYVELETVRGGEMTPFGVLMESDSIERTPAPEVVGRHLV